MAVQVAVQAAALADLLETSEDPIASLTGWAGSALIAIVTTVLKQGAVFVLARFGSQP